MQPKQEVNTELSGHTRLCIQLIICIAVFSAGVTVNGWQFTPIIAGSSSAPVSISPSTSGCQFLPRCANSVSELRMECALQCSSRSDCFGFYTLLMRCQVFNASAFLKERPWINVAQQSDIFAPKVYKATFNGCTQSSDYGHHRCQAAIDGNRNPDWWANSCSHTDHSSGEWWQGLLSQVSLISYVTIYNRNHMQERLQIFSLQVDNVECNGVNLTVPFTVSKNFSCMMSGRNVKVLSLQPNTPLHMCEVEVYAVETK